MTGPGILLMLINAGTNQMLPLFLQGLSLRPLSKKKKAYIFNSNNIEEW